MKRLLLCLLLAAPLGCASAGGPWMSEFDKDPDLQVHIWGPDEALNKAAVDAETASKK